MTHEEVLDKVNVIYERVSNYERYRDKNNLFSDGNYTEALEVLIDYYEVGFIEELKKIKEEIQKENNYNPEIKQTEYMCGKNQVYKNVISIINKHITELKGK